MALRRGRGTRDGGKSRPGTALDRCAGETHSITTNYDSCSSVHREELGDSCRQVCSVAIRCDGSVVLSSFSLANSRLVLPSPGSDLHDFMYSNGE